VSAVPNEMLLNSTPVRLDYRSVDSYTI
jgi:hypothetical protein